MAISFKPVNSKTLRVNKHTVKAGETIAVGDPVALDANGLIVCAGTGSTTLAGVAAEAVSSAASGAKIGIYDDPKQLYVAKADDVNQVLQSAKGDTADLSGTTGAFYVDIDGGSTAVFRIVAIGTERDKLQAASSSTTFSFNDGKQVYVEINEAKHSFGS